MAYLKNMKFLILVILIIIITLFFIGTNVNTGIPDNLKEKASKLTDKILVTKNNLEKYQSEYNQIDKNTDSYKLLEEIIQKESLESKFKNSHEQINQANLLYENNITPLLKDNKAEQIPILTGYLEKIENLLEQADTNMRYPSARLARIQIVMDDLESFHKASIIKALEFSTMVQDFENKIIPKIKQDFPGIDSRLDKRFLPLIELKEKINQASKILNDLFLSYQENPSIDFGKFTDQVDLIANQYDQLEKTKNQYKKKLLSVYISYNKILDDMKETTIDGNHQPSYFHKYFIEINGETNKNQDWVEVSKKFYNANKENLGMAIMSKKIGQFEDEANIHPTPPGLAYMGDPKYGKWETDSNGNKFWSWYGKYAFFSSLFAFPPRSFGYNRWDTFNRNYRYDRPYYGKTSDGYRQYGTKGSFTKKSSRYQSSSIGQTGGLSSQSPSVRKAASKIRGGGPGSRGK